jgi:uncharacterized protein DUF4189
MDASGAVYAADPAACGGSMRRPALVLTFLLAMPVIASAQSYGALAVGTKANGIIVGGASWNQDSQQAAIGWAISKCQEFGGRDCHQVSNTSGSGGCGFLSLSNVANAKRPQRWGTGPTPQLAYDQRVKGLPGGLDCLDPIGGCND